jgi:hypothetical protein
MTNNAGGVLPAYDPNEGGGGMTFPGLKTGIKQLFNTRQTSLQHLGLIVVIMVMIPTHG